jgi:hypothetical protein
MYCFIVNKNQSVYQKIELNFNLNYLNYQKKMIK